MVEEVEEDLDVGEIGEIGEMGETGVWSVVKGALDPSWWWVGTLTLRCPILRPILVANEDLLGCPRGNDNVVVDVVEVSSEDVVVDVIVVES